MSEKKPLFDMSRIATSIVLVAFIFVASLIFLGAWNKAGANSEKINMIDKKVDNKTIGFEYFIQEQRTFNSEQKESNKQMLRELKELNRSVMELGRT